MKLSGLYDCTWIMRNNEPCVVLFCRDSNGVKQIGYSKSFYPYLYVDTAEYLRNQTVLSPLVKKVEAVNKPFIFDSNKRLTKLVLKSPGKSYDVKKMLTTTYEGDIHFPTRYIIDEIEKLEPGKNRIAYVDIETTSEKSFPDYRNPNEEIITIGLYDNLTDKYFQWIWHSTFSVKTENIEGNRIVYRFSNEVDMLNHFLDEFHTLSPDYFTAWNVLFDIHYICARVERLGLDINKLSPLYDTTRFKEYSPNTQLVKWQEGKGLIGKKSTIKEKDEKNIRILGLQWFDLLTAYRFLIRDERPSWKLDDVAQKELGISKTLKGQDVGKIWKDKPMVILDYNYNDVMLIKMIDEKLKVIDYFKTIKDLAYLININDALSSGRILDNYMLKKYHDVYVFPSKKYVENKEDVAGGFVRTAKAGIYKNVAIFDFSGCYPNIIKTFNLSPDTFVSEKRIFNDNSMDEEDNVNLFNLDSMYSMKDNKVTYMINTEKYKAEVTYDMNRKGLLIQLIDELVALRKKAKAEANKYEYDTLEHKQWSTIEQSYKPIINGIFGCCAYAGFRLYNNPTACAITSLARMLSKYVGHMLKLHSYEIVSGDTDSIFVQLKTESYNDNIKEVSEVVFPTIKLAIKKFVAMFLPEEYHKFNTLEMDNEKIYSSLLLMDVKKRYIGLLKHYKDKQVDNKLHFMGLDLKKSNTIAISKNAQMDVALALLKGENVTPIIKKYYEKVILSFDIDDFKIASKLEKSQEEYKSKTPAVRATLWSNEKLHKHYRASSKFYILWVTEDKKLNTNIIAFDEKEDLVGVDFKIDKINYLEDVYNKIDNIVRGLPKIKAINDSIFMQYSSKNKSLEDYQ